VCVILSSANEEKSHDHIKYSEKDSSQNSVPIRDKTSKNRNRRGLLQLDKEYLQNPLQLTSCIPEKGCMPPPEAGTKARISACTIPLESTEPAGVARALTQGKELKGMQITEGQKDGPSLQMTDSLESQRIPRSPSQNS